MAATRETRTRGVLLNSDSGASNGPRVMLETP
jgi:hypothetical protein